MLIVPCIILFRIFCNFSALCSKLRFMHYSQIIPNIIVKTWNKLSFAIMLIAVHDYSIRVL